MCYNIASKVKALSRKSNKDEGVALLHNPAYREKYRERFDEAQKKVMDIVQFYDGTIILIENRIAMYYYAWHSKKREFERRKQQAVVKNVSCST